MVKQFMKKRSKRVSTRTRTKIERKVKEHNRKVKKEAKKGGNSAAKAKRKDPGVPNSLPFKEEILAEAEARKKRLEEERLAQKERAKKERETARNKVRNLSQLVSETKKKTDDFNKKNHIKSDAPAAKTAGEKADGSLKAYYKEFKKVVEAADVVLQVLDARDPLGSRCRQVEEAVLAARPSKRLVLVLNKIDLIPRENAQAWLTHLRREFPTVVFKASTQAQQDNLSQVALKNKVATVSDDLLKGSRCLGADLLMNLLASYGQAQASVRKAISVGVVGLPNTGKSSIINSLKRSRVCNVGSAPGITREMQEVKIDKHVKLLDSPGIVMAAAQTDAALILRNCLRVEALDDPQVPVAAILARCPRETMMLQYNITPFRDVTEFLALVARRHGQLKKGGVPDAVRAARTVLHDWNNGRITYFTHPPEADTAEVQVSAEIRAEMSAGFDVEALVRGEEGVLAGLRPTTCTDMVVDSAGPAIVADEKDLEESEDVHVSDNDEQEGDEGSSDEEMDEEDEEEEAGELARVEIAPVPQPKPAAPAPTPEEVRAEKRAKKAANKAKISKNLANTVNARQGLLKMNLEKKNALKKSQKERRRADSRGKQLGSALESALSGVGAKAMASSAAYSFETDLTI